MNEAVYQEMKTIGAYVKDCSLGRILIGETNEGICSVIFGESTEELMDELRSIFPEDKIELKTGSSPDTIIKLIDEGIRDPNLRLDIRTGTETQQRVWLEIMRIPIGKTMTYTELAEKTGNPKAWRSVATACAKNILAVVIPCHRVISKNGEKMNYRWGADRKMKLLEREKK